MSSLMRSIRPQCAKRIWKSRPRLVHSTHHPTPTGKDWGQPPSSTKIDDGEILKLASKPLHALRLADLITHGRPPLSKEALFQSANFTLSLLPVRLAKRIQALRNLPFIVVSNPNVSKIYDNYLHSLSTLLPWCDRQISTLEDEILFTNVLADLVQTHSNTIPILAQGFLECRKYINPRHVTAFLDEHLRVRIGTRLIAEQHIALHSSSQPHHASYHTGDIGPSSYIGVIDTALQPACTIDMCGNFVADICDLKYGTRPTWVIDGEPSTTLAFVPVHLEYIVTEILKNAFRATVESGSKEPVVVTIAAEPNLPTSDRHETDSKSEGPRLIEPLSDFAPGATIRIRDRGGGIDPKVLPNIYSYSFTTFSEDHEFPGTNSTSMEALSTVSSLSSQPSSIAGLGYGLPLSRAYAEYFGGSVSIESLWGWGSDVYLRVKGVGRIE